MPDAHAAVADYPDVQKMSDAPLVLSFKSKKFLDLVSGGDAGEIARLKEVLERKHPEYDANIKYWQRLGDIGFSRLATRGDKKAYLVRGSNEGDNEFNNRAELAQFVPEIRGLLNDFIGAVFGVPATREIKEEAKADTKTRAEAFINMAGIAEEPLEEMSKRALRVALIYNQVDAFLDHPASTETSEPYVWLLSPEDRYDWEMDEKGRYVWAKYHEKFTTQADWSGERATIDEYRIITKDSITTWHVINKAGEQEKAVLASDVKHKFHDIPIRTLYWDRAGNAWAKELVDLDVKTFRQEADHTHDVFQVARPTLTAALHPDPETGQKTYDSISRGSSKVIHLDPGNEDRNPESVAYLQADMGDIIHQAEHIEKLRETSRRLAGVGGEMEKGGGEGAGNPESGVALAYRQAQREKNYRQAAQALAEWEWQLLELVLRETGSGDLKREDVIELRYPDSFDLRTPDELAVNLDDAKATGSDTLVKEIKKAMATRLLGSGASIELLQEIHEEIEEFDEQEANDIENGMITPVEREMKPPKKEPKT